MCGRYYVDDHTAREIERLVKYIDRKINYKKACDVHPSEAAVILSGGDGCLQAKRMRWGFPQYSGKGFLINARAETVTERRTFRDSVLNRRCIIPASRFYEWDSSKNKVTFFSPDKPVLYMAGFYQSFQSEERFMITTTKANESVSLVHARMPLLLEQHELMDWIYDGGLLDSMLKKTPLLLKQYREYEQQTLF